MGEILFEVKNRTQFREWLSLHSDTENECFLALKRGKPTRLDVFYYLDAVEEALCFGWIDSTLTVQNGMRTQRFTPRRKNSTWTELNKERVRRLEKLGLMTESGRKVLPEMDEQRFQIDPEIKNALIAANAWENFLSFPPLYQRIRASNVAFYQKRNRAVYEKALSHLIEKTQKGELFGEWNDYGRLLDY